MEKRAGRKKKRYGLLVLLLVLNWLAIAWVFVKVDPEKIKDVVLPNTYLPVLVLVFGGFFWLLSILLLSAKKALRWSLGVVLFLYLRLNGLGNVLNGGLILGILVALEFHFSGIKNQDAIISEQTEQTT